MTEHKGRVKVVSHPLHIIFLNVSNSLDFLKFQQKYLEIRVYLIFYEVKAEQLRYLKDFSKASHEEREEQLTNHDLNYHKDHFSLTCIARTS